MRRTLKDLPVVYFKPYLLFVLNLHKFLRTWKDTRKSSRFPGDTLLSWNDKASLQSNLSPEQHSGMRASHNNFVMESLLQDAVLQMAVTLQFNYYIPPTHIFFSITAQQLLVSDNFTQPQDLIFWLFWLPTLLIPWRAPNFLQNSKHCYEFTHF